MVNKLLLPQEIETFYIIPTLRKHLAIALKQNGMKQKDVAEIFGINTAAISQYTQGKRGDKVIFDQHVVDKVNEVAPKITNKFTYLYQMQQLLQYVRQTKALCKVHKLFSHVPEDCEPQTIGCHSGGCS